MKREQRQTERGRKKERKRESGEREKKRKKESNQIKRRLYLTYSLQPLGREERRKRECICGECLAVCAVCVEGRWWS